MRTRRRAILLEQGWIKESHYLRAAGGMDLLEPRGTKALGGKTRSKFQVEELGERN